MLTIDGRRYDTGEPVRVVTRGPRIASVQPAWPQSDCADWPLLAPGLFDVQINGHGGVWFSDEALTPPRAAEAIRAYLRFGVTRLCPTLITNSFEGLAQGLRAIRAACEQDALVDHMVAACHLEGPYISAEDGPRGAHPREYVRPPDWDEFRKLQDISGGRVRLLTLAPETPGAIDFIRQAAAAGVVIAIGHTAATPEQIQAAVDAGARLSTHLGNGAHALVHRHRNSIWEQAAEPRLMASLIVDGHHLPASLVRAFVRLKTPRNVLLTCDAAGWAGCRPGLYENKLGKSELLENGKLVVAGQRELLAGSAYETDVCVAKVREFAGVSWRDAIHMASKQPAQLLGCEFPRLRRGGLADLFVFRHEPAAERLNVLATIVRGELVYGALPRPACLAGSL
uniref:N-acetylglucosamine-6-phosphate deacetylase n=1 Tax=Schlesneria paludicola TaxID=360056 RepID=A0A7C4QNE1_9PLAN